MWALPWFGDRKPFPFLNAAYTESNGRFSPDGKLVAYVSNESGRNEVYVATFPKADQKARISSAGGAWPRWRGDGKELFYLSPDNNLVAVEVRSSGSQFEAGAAQTLFKLNPRMNAQSPYAVTANGQRFIANLVVEDVSEPLTLTVNWPALLKK